MITFLPQSAGFPGLLDHHRGLLGDAVRTRAFVEAIQAAVRPGDVVADVGTGTGILAWAAERAGAARVHAVEVAPIAGAAAALLAANGCTRVTLHRGDAFHVPLPEPLDLIVSECLGVLAVGGTMIQAVLALRDRSLRPGGRVVPSKVRVWAQPIEAPAFDAYVRGWLQPHQGYVLAPAEQWVVHNLFQVLVEPGMALAAPQLALELDLEHGAFDGAWSSQLSFACERAGTLHGWACWFDAELQPGVWLRTGPREPETIWKQVFLPLARAEAVGSGERVQLALGATATSPRAVPVFGWTSAGAAFRHDQSTDRSWP